jgi:3'(2'), 5'-bisphosphate nucleotidase
MPTTAALRDALLRAAIPLARRAGQEIVAIARTGALGTRGKSDDSPVTLADLRSNEILLEGLARASGEPIVSEESPELIGAGREWDKGAFWAIDPLDGTRDFVAGHPTYVVNIALIENGRPVLGVVHVPESGITYWASAGGGAFKDGAPIANASTRTKLFALASRSHPSPRMTEFLRQQGIGSVQRMGSAIKFCLLAEGLADVYPRFGRTYEWDTAAGHAILNEAGCQLLAIDDGQPLRYGKPAFLNGGFVAARGDLNPAAAMRALCESVGDFGGQPGSCGKESRSPKEGQ